MMLSIFDESEHVDFDPDRLGHTQKLKGVSLFSTGFNAIEVPPLEVIPKMKKRTEYKIKQKQKEQRDAAGKLF